MFFNCLFHCKVDNKYQSNLNEIGKYEHKSSLDTLNNKGFSWTTDHIGYNLGNFFIDFAVYFRVHPTAGTDECSKCWFSLPN